MTPQRGTQRPVDTVAMIWAHYDDDLVFANPTLLGALADGSHAHSLFLTASDAGAGMSGYVDGREAGIRYAYDKMRGVQGTWSDDSVTLSNGVTLTVTRPDGDDRISLSFLRLPDGGLRGGGYAATGWQSLAKLVAGELGSLRTLDTGQEITLEQLRSTAAEVVAACSATTVISNYPGFEDPPGDDHPDHQSVGRIVASAVASGEIDPGIAQYAIGYPSARLPANIPLDLLTRKLEVFAAYGAHDPVVTRAEVQDYLHVRGFGEWLQRQYLMPHGELAPVDSTAEPIGDNG